MRHRISEYTCNNALFETLLVKNGFTFGINDLQKVSLISDPQKQLSQISPMCLNVNSVAQIPVTVDTFARSPFAWGNKVLFCSRTIFRATWGNRNVLFILGFKNVKELYEYTAHKAADFIHA